ncbi:MAG: helix-turn-helix transcriptional regulator [Opitutales bacterium]
MGRQSTEKTILRQWELLRRIPARVPGKTAAQLTDELALAGFKVDKRTVERDLCDLSDKFGLVSGDSKPYQWRWRDGQRDLFGEMELADAVPLCLAEAVLRSLLPVPLLEPMQRRFEQARRKLSALESNRLARWPEKVRYVSPSLAVQPPSLRPEVLDVVQRGLIEEKQLEVNYLPFNRKEAKELRLHSYCLIQRGTVPYLLAKAFDYSDLRLYAVHRIQSASLTADAIAPLEPGAVETFLQSRGAEFGDGDPIVLRAKVSSELGSYLAETPLAEDQRITWRDTYYELTATLRDTWQLHFWIMSQGSQITVIEPKSIRDSIAAEHRAAAASYK